MGRQFLLTNAAATGLTEAELVRQEQQHLELAGLSENNDRTSIGSARRPLSNPSDLNETGDNVDYATSRYNTDRDSGAASPNSHQSNVSYWMMTESSHLCKALLHQAQNLQGQ